MHFSTIEFGSLLSYSPRGSSDAQSRSRTVMRKLKNDEYLESKQILMSEYIAEGIKTNIKNLPFSHFFNANTILIPTPNSSLSKSDTLWVPQRLATALVKNGLGKDVKTCLQRTTPLRKSSTSLAANRPKASEHYNSISVQKILSEPNEILLVDDVITRGATLLGAANKLADVFPNSLIRAFAVIRTISSPDDFTKIFDPCIGTITLIGDDTFRDDEGV